MYPDHTPTPPLLTWTGSFNVWTYPNWHELIKCRHAESLTWRLSPSLPGSSWYPFNVKSRLSAQLTLGSVAVGVCNIWKSVLVLLSLLLDLSQSRAEFRFVASVFITKLAAPYGQATQSGLIAAHSPFSWQNHSRSRAGSLLPLMRLFIYQISLWTPRGKNKPGIAEPMINISKTELLKIQVQFCECDTS